MSVQLETTMPFATIDEAIEDIRQGKLVVVVDAADRENEGDLTIAAQFATPEAINFMATHGRGLICLCLTEERCDELDLKPMTYNNEAPIRDRVHDRDRGARGRDDRDLGRRPRAHDPGRDRPDEGPWRPRPARPRVPASRQPRRRSSAGRPDRSGRRSRASRRAQPRRGRLRDHERGRNDGPGARPGSVLRARTGSR